MVRGALLESMSSSKVTPELLCKRYYERMPSVARTVISKSCEPSLTIKEKLFDVPEMIHVVLSEAD